MTFPNMKLYLASNGFPTPTQFKQLVGKCYKEAKVAVIMAACDWRTLPERKERYEEMREGFNKLGIKPDVIDLHKFYKRKPISLAKKLNSYDLLWVRGGNVYFLRYVMNKSGFDEAIKIALANGLVYAAQSAGTLVVCPTLKYLDIVEGPRKTPNVIWKGIGLVKIVPLPHWHSSFIGEEVKKVYKLLVISREKVIRLTDEEALMVVGKKITKVKSNLVWK